MVDVPVVFVAPAHTLCEKRLKMLFESSGIASYHLTSGGALVKTAPFQEDFDPAANPGREIKKRVGSIPFLAVSKILVESAPFFDRVKSLAGLAILQKNLGPPFRAFRVTLPFPP